MTKRTCSLKNNEPFLQDAHPELFLLETLEGKSREVARKQSSNSLSRAA
jgi:hypothetical protein